MLRFKIFNDISVSIQPLFWFLAIAIAWLSASTIPEGILWVMVIPLSVLVHECGHALTAKAFGQDAQIELQALGGVTMRTGPKLKPWKTFMIVLNGPLAGFLLAGLSWWVWTIASGRTISSLSTYAFAITFYINVFWTIVNLLPVLPLDGGKLVAVFLEAIFGARGVKISILVSLVFSLLIALGFFILHSILTGSIFLMIAFENYRSWKDAPAGDVEYDQSQNDAWQLVLKEAALEFESGHGELALQKIEQVRRESKTGPIYNLATILASRIFINENKSGIAFSYLKPIEFQLKIDGLYLLHLAAYKEKHWHDVTSLGDRIYQDCPTGEIALMNAAAYSMLGDVRRSIGWLQSVRHVEFPGLDEVLKRKEFDYIRSDPLFKDFVSELNK